MLREGGLTLLLEASKVKKYPYPRLKNSSLQDSRECFQRESINTKFENRQTNLWDLDIEVSTAVTSVERVDVGGWGVGSGAGPRPTPDPEGGSVGAHFIQWAGDLGVSQIRGCSVSQQQHFQSFPLPESSENKTLKSSWLVGEIPPLDKCILGFMQFCKKKKQ